LRRWELARAKGDSLGCGGQRVRKSIRDMGTNLKIKSIKMAVAVIHLEIPLQSRSVIKKTVLTKCYLQRTNIVVLS
jgi:hypothetical protein